MKSITLLKGLGTILALLLSSQALAGNFSIILPYETASAPDTYSFEYGEYGLCDSSGTQTRSALCINDNSGDEVDLALCGVPELTQTCTPPLNLSLAMATLPAAQQHVPFNYNMASLLSFTGGNNVNQADAIFSSANAPAGLTVSPAGLLSGTPQDGSGSAFTLNVSLEGADVDRSYLLTINPSTYSLQYSSWGTCSAQGSQTRTATCRRNETSQTVAMSFCSAPVLSQSCTPPPITSSHNVSVVKKTISYNVNIGYSDHKNLPYGSISNKTVLNSLTIYYVGHYNLTNQFSVSIRGTHAKNAFKSLAISGYGTLNTSGASLRHYTDPAGNIALTEWSWKMGSPWSHGQSRAITFTK